MEAHSKTGGSFRQQQCGKTGHLFLRYLLIFKWKTGNKIVFGILTRADRYRCNFACKNSTEAKLFDFRF